MIVVAVFGLAVLHAAATKCIDGIRNSLWECFDFLVNFYMFYSISVGDRLPELDSEIKSGENFYTGNSLNDSKGFYGDFSSRFNKIIQEMTILSNEIKNLQPYIDASNYDDDSLRE